MLLVPLHALARDGGFYLGGALGQATFTEWCDPSAVLLACDDETTAWKLVGGYEFSRHLGIEATYIDWGKVSGVIAGTGGVSADQTSIGIAAVGSLPLGPQFSVFAKAGFLMTDQETRGATVRKRDDTEFHYGLGARFRLGANWAARAEWERTEKLEVETLSIGVEFGF